MDEVFIIIDDIWVVKHCQNFDLVNGGLSVQLVELLDRDLLDDHLSVVGSPSTQVDGAKRAASHYLNALVIVHSFRQAVNPRKLSSSSAMKIYFWTYSSNAK